MYRALRRLPAETAHEFALWLIRAAGTIPGVAAGLRRLLGPRDPALRVRALGLDFPGPLGLAAGFDKDARGVPVLGAIGFGFVEVGTVTALAQPGNQKPRLFRLMADRAIVNRMGFNNHGAEAAAQRLRSLRLRDQRPTRRATRLEAPLQPNPASTHRSTCHAPGGARLAGPRVIVGVNIGKTRVVSAEDAVADYVASARAVAGVADYVVVNVSSPNTPGLRDLQSVDRLRPLLTAVRDVLDGVPLLVKIAPDLADEDIDAIADLAVELRLDGIIATNTTTSREGLTSPPDEVAASGVGGLSGPPLRERSLAVLRRLRERTASNPPTETPPAPNRKTAANPPTETTDRPSRKATGNPVGGTGGDLVLIAAGGIESADDAWERLEAGATLIQAYTGFVYGGPLWPWRINAGLAARARAADLRSISDLPRRKGLRLRRPHKLGPPNSVETWR